MDVKAFTGKILEHFPPREAGRALACPNLHLGGQYVDEKTGFV